MLALLADAHPTVPVWAAVSALWFAPANAGHILASVAGGPPSPERLNAEFYHPRPLHRGIPL